jgi:ABC-type nitrate/sulfonate/bicarbonate transport system substrate-binding protein
MTRLTRRQFSKAALGSAGAAVFAATGLPGLARADTTLNFQSVWLNDPEFLGYMIAIDNGYYAAEGLTVNYMPGGPDVIPEGSLLSGKADIALTNIVTTAKAEVERGAPLVIIGTQYQKSPLGVISLASANINGPKDLVGKTVACPPLSQNAFYAVLKIAGVSTDQLRVVPYTFDPTPLIDGDVDAVVDFVTQIPFLVEQKSGKKASYFLFWDFGLPLYVDLVVVTKETLGARRDDLVKFLRASRKGWAENFADPKKYPQLFQDTWFKGLGSTIEAELYFNQTQLGLMDTPKGIFYMSDEGIDRNIDALSKLGIAAKRDMFDTTLFGDI